MQLHSHFLYIGMQKAKTVITLSMVAYQNDYETTSNTTKLLHTYNTRTRASLRLPTSFFYDSRSSSLIFSPRGISFSPPLPPRRAASLFDRRTTHTKIYNHTIIHIPSNARSAKVSFLLFPKNTGPFATIHAPDAQPHHDTRRRISGS